MSDLSVVLVGAVNSTQVVFDSLVKHGVPPRLLMTLPENEAHRHSDHVDLVPMAEAIGAEVWQGLDINSSDAIKRVTAHEPDVVMVVGWSRICGPEFLSQARVGTIGYHPTQLPRMRGRAALAWTILLDLTETAGTLFWMDEGMDSGDIAAQRSFVVPRRVRLPELMGLQMEALDNMLESLLPRLLANETPRLVQDHSQASYLAHRRPEDGLIDWSCTADEIDRLIRAVTAPYPGAFTYLRDEKLTVWEAEPVSMPQWHASVGQVFTYEAGMPVVRCGSGTSLLVRHYELPAARLLRGQVRLGIRL